MEDLRRLLTTYAYNIIGSYEDAKDIVQDAYLKIMNVEESLENKKAYLIRTVINLSINFKNRQKKLRFEYPGHGCLNLFQPKKQMLRSTAKKLYPTA